MENQTIIKKIISFIANLFKVIIIMILNIIRAIFGKSKNSMSIDKSKINQVNNDKLASTSNKGGANTGLPDEDNIKNNNHSNGDDDTTNDVILELPKYKINNLNKKIDDNKLNILTYELINELIDLELEEVYKEEKFKVKDASKEVEEKIKELKEKIIPKIIEKINNNKLQTRDEVKKEVKEVVKKELEEKPILKKVEIKEVSLNENIVKKEDNNLVADISDKSIQNNNEKDVTSFSNLNPNSNKDKKDDTEIYFVAKPRKKDLNIKDNTLNKANTREKVASVVSTTTLEEKLENTPVKMVKNVDVIPKPTIKDNIANVAVASTIIAASSLREVLVPEKEKNAKEKEIATVNIEDKQPEVKEEDKKVIDIPGVKDVSQVKDELERDTKSIEELKDLQSKLEEKIEKIKREEKKDPVEENIVKDLIKDTEISAIAQTSEAIIDDSIDETKKEDFEDKDYDRIERQIDKMLEDISNTYLRYEDKMTPKQKAKLEAEEEKLRNTREHIRDCKRKDIAVEERLLDEDISPKEIDGLQNELKRLDVENKIEANEALLKRLDSLEGMTREQVAKVDKRILNKRLRKASLLLEMSSLLAFPFVRNKYFFYLTAGLIVDNHFNFINAFFNRKVNKYEPADLSQIRKGQDALDGALDVTYKNLVELDYIEQQALERYPELAYDPQFISQVTGLRTKLNQNYNKLMRKNKMMEKYYSRIRQQKKILKKDLKPEHK